MRMPSPRSGLLALGGVLLAGTFVVAGLDTDAASSPLAGSCVDRDANAASCSDPAAVFQVLTVVEAGDPCPRGDYFEQADDAGTLCLGHNVEVGDCIQDDPEGPTRVPCAAEVRRPTIRVVEIVDGQATAKACPPVDGEGVRGLTYSVPARTVCIVHLPLATAG